MRAFKRDIVICIITALATLSAVYYFFGNMKEGKNAAQTDLYSLTALKPDALLAINRPAFFSKSILTKPSVYKAFACEIPEIYLSIIKDNPTIPAILFSFHPQGVVMYAKIDKIRATDIEKKIIMEKFNAFAPQKQSSGDITFTFFPDTENRFFGYYQHNGIWVSSYSKKLLEEVADIQTSHKHHLQADQEKIRRSLDPNAPANLMVQTDLLDLYVKVSDSTQWRFNEKWLGADLFESEGNVCYFSTLPYHEPADTLYQTIADTLSIRLKTFFPQIQITSQIMKEQEKVYYTGCIL